MSKWLTMFFVMAFVVLIGATASFAAGSKYVKDEVIVKFNEEVSLIEKNRAFGHARATLLPDTDPVTLHTVLKVADVKAAVQSLKENPYVEYAEPNYILKATWIPNDTLYTGYQYGPKNTDTERAWDITRGTELESIAVIDTGVDYRHEDLKNKTIKGYDFVQDDWRPMDQNDHGTHVAGIAAAQTNNATGIAGMAPATKILAVRVLDARGSGTLSDVADGIIYSADAGAEVLNLSLGCNCDSQTLRDAVNYAWNKGSVVVAAAGNEGTSTTFEPASYDKVIAVGAVDRGDEKPYWSNYGNWVDVSAPGVDIVSLIRHKKYAYMSGTSMASPHVAGLAGLLAGQGFNNVQIRQAIEQGADPISGTGTYTQHGRINSYKATTY